MITVNDLYHEVIKKNIPIACHASDLYIKVTPESTNLINQYEFKNIVRKFNSNDNTGIWFDVPFAYIPFWQQKSKES